MRVWMWLVVATAALWGGVAQAQEARGGSGFCLASDDRTNTYYHSDVFPSDPRVATETYRDQYAKALAAKGLDLPVSCQFTDLPDRIPVYLSGLRQQCPDCAVYDVRKFAWSPNAADAEPVPAEVAAPLPQLESIVLDGEANAFVQVHTRMFACGDEIRMSYSLRPVPERGIDAVPFRGVITINGRAQPFDAGLARPIPGHVLSCGPPSLKVARLSDYEDRLVSGRFSDGKVMWTRKQMIEQLLASVLVFHVDHVPLKDVQRLPPGPAPVPPAPPPAVAAAPADDAQTAGLNRDVAARNAEVEARNAAVRETYERQQAAFEAAKAKYEAEAAAHAQSVKAAEEAKAAYERQLEAYRKQLEAPPPRR